MNHQTFENWILDDTPLSKADAQSLRAHLETCKSCRTLAEAWGAVETLFAETPAPDPKPGFSKRWLATLEREQAIRAALPRRQAWAALALLGGGTLFTFGLLTWQFLRVYDSFTGFLLASLARITYTLALLIGWQSALSILARTLMGLIPFYGWAGLAVLLTLATLLWMFSLAKFSTQPRRLT